MGIPHPLLLGRPRIGLAIVGALLLGLTGMLFWDWYAEFQTRHWEQVPCEVVISKVTDRPRGDRMEYTPLVVYNYQYQGKNYRSDQYYLSSRFSGGTFSQQDYAKVAQLVNAFPRGSTNTCFINPAHPEQAVLRRRLGYTGLVMSIVVPGTLIFIFWLQSHRPKIKVRPAPELSPQPLTRRPRRKIAFGSMGLGVFLLAMGLGCFFGLDYHNRAAINETARWRPVPCFILRSRVEKDTSMHGQEYQLNVLYLYELDGREYRCNTYQAGTAGSGSYRRQLQRAHRYIPGTMATCYVNPEAPGQAVLNTHFEWEFGAAFYGFLLMTVVGSLSLVIGLTQQFAPRSSLAGALDKEIGELIFGGGPRIRANDKGGLTLSSSQGDPLRLAALLVGALVGAGVVAAEIWNKILDWRVGVIQVSVFDFIIPLIACAGVGWCLKQFWFGLAPQPRFQIFPAQVRPGGSLSVEWQFTGKVERLQDVEVALEGREEVDIHETVQGAHGNVQKKRIVRSRFVRLPLLAGAQGKALEWGAGKVTVPPGAMHSFDGDKCRVLWCLTVNGTFSAKRPLKHEFKVRVLPGEEALV